MRMTRNVFVLGLDQGNLDQLRNIPGTDDCVFHGLLTEEELVSGEQVALGELLDKAERQLADFDGTIDAIIGYWDFPTSSMVPILCRRHGLRSASLDAVVTCEHKYWSRLRQQEVIDEYPPVRTREPRRHRTARGRPVSDVDQTGEGVFVRTRLPRTGRRRVRRRARRDT